MSKSYIAKIESNGTVKVYDAVTGSVIRAIGSCSGNVSVQTNGNIVAITERNGITKTYDADSGRCLRTL